MTNFPRIAILYWVVLFLFSIKTFSQNFRRNTANTPVSTQRQIDNWSHISNDQLGVAAIDPIGHRIGPNAANRTFVGKNWYPLDLYKKTLIGRFYHFNFYDGLGDEADWNFFIIPASKFRYILTDVFPIADMDDVHDCETRNDCAEGEITPDESFYENPYFNKSSGSSPLEGQNIGMYGPWVYEEAHGNRPEIHPSEMIWWRGTGANSNLYFLMLLQDDSNRFDRVDNYSGTIVHPWSKVPRRGEFRIPFEVGVPRPEVGIISVKNYFINELHTLNVVTESDAVARVDSDDGKDHGLEYNGRVLLTVKEMQIKDDNIGVRFEEITRNSSNTRLQGYIVISSKIGVNDRGREGLHLIRVNQSTTFGPIIIQAIKDTVKPVTARLLGHTLKLSPDKRLLYDVELLTGQPGPSTVLVDVTLKTPSGQRRPTFTKSNAVVAGQKRQLGVIREVDAFQRSTLEVKTSNSAVSLPIPQIALAPKSTTLKRSNTVSSPKSLNNFLKAVANMELPNNIQSDLASKLKHNKEIESTVIPGYATLRNGKVSMEDGNPVTEELNRMFDVDEDRPSRLSAAQLQIQTKWTFSAKNLVTGSPVTISSSPGGSQITVKTLTGSKGSSTLKVTFPDQPEDAIFEVAATCEFSDILGNKGTITKTIWSHSLSDPNQGSLMRSVLTSNASIAGVNPANVFMDINADNLPLSQSELEDPQQRRKRSINLVALHAVQNDNVIDIKEMANILGMVKLLKEQ